MSFPRNASKHSDSNLNSPRTRSWLRRIAVALAVTGIIGTALVITLAVMAARFVGGAVDYLQSVDMAAFETRLAEAALELDQRQRESIMPLLDKLKNNGLALPQREEIERDILKVLSPEQRKQIETWKNIGATGTIGLEGLMAYCVRWLEEFGVPIDLLTNVLKEKEQSNSPPR